MLNTNFAPWPNFSKEEAEAISSVLLSNKVNYWTGSHCREFEREFADYTNSQYAIALANGTVALDLALIALGIGPGDEVIVTSRTFLASVSSIISVGARPIFADVELDSQNISEPTIRAVLTESTKAIICVHLAGRPCEMDEIMELADKHNIKVIEDCAQAHGAQYKGRSVGSIGHIGAWSFCQDKIMTTGGEGGMVTTNDHELWKLMWSYKDHGKSFDAVYNQEHKPGFRWLHESFGTNWRMMEIQAVIGRIQLKRLDEWIVQRQNNAAILLSICDKFGCVEKIAYPDYVNHAQYKFYFFIKPEMLKDSWDRDRIIHEINALGVPCFEGSCSEVYLEKAFDGTGIRPANRLENAKKLGQTSVMMLVHPSMTESDLKLSAESLVNVLTQAIKDE